MSILFISNSNFSRGLSGGDRIFLELIRQWQYQTSLAVIGATETKELLVKYQLSNVPFYLTSKKNSHITPSVVNVIKLQLTRTVLALIYILRNQKLIRNFDTIYSVSDFYADFFPALLIKIISPKVKWIVGYYLIAPNPISKHSPYNRNRQFLKGWIYYLSQKITLSTSRRFADFVFVTSEPETSNFISPRLSRNKIIVVRGGVDTKEAHNYLAKNKLKPPQKRKFVGCFIGRLHPQKGVIELIKIWKKVVDILPLATLAIIGDGELKKQLKTEILKQNLKNNIYLFGFLDGNKKNNIFKQSAIILHPATYDSGGMAAAEAMAWGIPGISFDLPSLKTYYPKGMIKVPLYDQNSFAQQIVNLFTNKKLYDKTSTDAFTLIKEQWQWPNRAKEIYNQLNLNDK